MIHCKKDTQSISQPFIIQPTVEVFFFSDQFCNKYHNGQQTKRNYKRTKNMITNTFVNITLIKIYKRFGNAAAGAGEARKHFKRAKRLVGF